MKRDDWTACDHHASAVIVTNQPGAYVSTRSHRSTWVCDRPECVLDAMAWVRRGTGEKPWWREGTTGTWSDGMYPQPTVQDHANGSAT
jgi:hypothetical protein